MRNHIALRLVRVLNLVTPAVTLSAVAQTSAIPPLTSGQVEERRSEAVADTALQGAVALPTAILEGGKILTQKLDPGSLGQMMSAAEKGSAVLSYSLAGAKIIKGTAADGWEGFAREGTQAVLDKAGDMAGQAASGVATALATGAGAALGTASGVAGISYATGSVAGTWLRSSPDVGHAIGLHGTVGDWVDDQWITYTPDTLKEFVSGTKQIDINDAGVQQQMFDTARRNQRQAMFDNVQRENLEQQQHIQAAAGVPVGGEFSNPQTPMPTTNALNEILSAAQAVVTSPAMMSLRDGGGAAKGGTCKLDPQTGCHPGHDEKSHPGGCKKC